MTPVSRMPFHDVPDLPFQRGELFILVGSSMKLVGVCESDDSDEFEQVRSEVRIDGVSISVDHVSGKVWLQGPPVVARLWMMLLRVQEQVPKV